MHHVLIVELLLAMVAYDITIVETWNSFGIERLPDFKHEALCERPGFSAVHDPCSLRAFGCRMVLCEIFRVIAIIFVSCSIRFTLFIGVSGRLPTRIFSTLRAVFASASTIGMVAKNH